MIQGEAWYMIRELLREGVSVSEIARRTGRDLGVAECAGVVQNISDRSLSGVQVEVTWLNNTGTLLTADRGFIDLNPLLAGQSSPWKLSALIQATASQFRVSFSDLSGTLAVRPASP